jgi:hypothetical protein
MKKNSIKYKGGYGVNLFFNDSTKIHFSEPYGCIYINDSIIDTSIITIDIYSFNYSLSKYKVKTKHYTFRSKELNNAMITIRYKRTRHVLIWLGLKKVRCNNGSIW